MFDRFTRKHELKQPPLGLLTGLRHRPRRLVSGDAYVDLIGQDHYPMDGNDGPAKDVFDELAALGRGTKLVGMSENGPIPDPDRLVSEQAAGCFFVTGRTNVDGEELERETGPGLQPSARAQSERSAGAQRPSVPTGRQGGEARVQRAAGRRGPSAAGAGFPSRWRCRTRQAGPCARAGST